MYRYILNSFRNVNVCFFFLLFMYKIEKLAVKKKQPLKLKLKIE